MNKTKLSQWKDAAGIVCLGLLTFSGAMGALGATITVLGSNPPIPGPNDQYQTNYVAVAQSPPPGGGAFDYYVDHDPAPGQTFTTGSNPNGYVLNSLSLYDADNTGGGFGNESFTLAIYSVAGSTATLMTSYTSQSIALTDFTWFQWTSLGVVLQPNTQYAYAMWANGSGWMNVGNDNVSYSGGQVAMVPRAGGAMTFSTSSPWNGDFDVGLTAITTPVVAQPTFSPYSITLPGSTVTASAVVTGPGPYFFQWQTDGGSGGALTNIPGGTSSNLVINTTGFALGNYQYDLVVSNNTSSVTSQVAVLTIQQPTGIAGVIAIKFGFTNGWATSDAPFPADNAGVATGQLVPPSYQPLAAVGDWNDLMASITNGSSSPQVAAAIDQTWNITYDTAGNALSGVTLTPSGFDDGWFSGGTECANGRLLYDCWKFNTSNGQSDSFGHNYATLTFANLPGAQYDVYLYINDNNGNYWGNAQANSVIAQGSDSIDDSNFGFNGADSDPCGVSPSLHTAAGFGNPVNYLKLPYVATSGGEITITVVSFGGGDMGVSGVELVPSPDLTLVQDTLPTYAESVVGDQVVFAAAFSNSPAVNLQWQRVSGGVTIQISSGVANVTNNGTVTSTLTLNNLQLADAGSYQLEAINAANSMDYAYSSGAQLLVSNPPSPTNGIVLFYDGQVGANFYPPWTINTNADLIFNYPISGSSGQPGTSFPGPGNYGLDGCNGDPTILSDGVLGDSKATMVSCGPNGGAGQSMTYTLLTNSAPLGYELTNIQVYGGWTDAGRVNQDYIVWYATVSYPTNWINLLQAHYLPADPSGAAMATRTGLVATNGVLAHNVVAVKIDWNIPPPQDLNGYAGYSEIVVSGTNSTQIAVPPVLLQDMVPQTASDVVGSQIAMTAIFTNYTSLQWQMNGTNIAGATSPTLVLNNLQMTNGGSYTLVASNSIGTKSSSPCVVTVNPVSAPVNNAIVSMAAQTESSSVDPVFIPTWNSNTLTASLIYDVAPSGSGNGDFTGAFDGDGANLPAVLTDGSFGQDDHAVTGTHSSFSVIGYDTRAGNFVDYALSSSTNGYNITNITVYGGWSDNGRDGQAYTVYYSTVANTNWVSLGQVNYLPGNPNGWYCMTRSTITPASGILASNVTALHFDFTTPPSPGGENGFEGYSEISVFGSASAPLIVAPHISSVTESGGNLIVTGSGGYPPSSGYTLLSTTNLTPPVVWTTNSTGTLDGTGAFSNSIPINPSRPNSFFRLRIP